jgi:hypothetical protein
MIETMRRRTTPSLLVLAGDLVCFVIFAVMGLRSHEDGITLSGLVRAAVPFQAGWIAANAVIGQPSKAPRGVEGLISGVLKPFVPAWIIGLVLRTVVFGRDFAPTFAVVAFVTNLLLLGIWHMLAAHVVKPATASRE